MIFSRNFLNKTISTCLILCLFYLAHCVSLPPKLYAAETTYTQWNLPVGAKIRLGKGRINDIVYAPDGKKFAVATAIGIWIYSADTGKELTLITGHDIEIETVAFTQDAQYIISADSGGECRKWDVTSRELIEVIAEGNVIFNKVDISDNGTTLVTYNQNSKFHIKNINDPEAEHNVFDDTERDPRILKVSPNGRTIAIAKTPFSSPSEIAPKNYRLQVWDTKTQSLLINLQGEKPYIHGIEFTPDGTNVVTSDIEGDIQFWNVATGTTTLTFKANNRGTTAIAFAPKGKILATGDFEKNTLQLWKMPSTSKQPKSIQTLKGHKSYIRNCVFSPDEKTILTASQNGIIMAWDVVTGKQKYNITGHVGRILELTHTDSGNNITSANSNVYVWSHPVTHLRNWDIKTGSLTSTALVELIKIETVSPNCKIIVYTKEDKKIHLWDTETKKNRLTISADEEYKLSKYYILSSNEEFLAIGSTAGPIYVWKITDETKTSEPWKSLSSNSKSTMSITFSPDGKLLASDDGLNTIHLWNVSKEEILSTFTITGKHGDKTSTYYRNNSRGLVISPDGKKLACGREDAIYLWDTETGDEISVLIPERLSNSYMTLLFSTDSNILLSACNGTIIKYAPGQIVKPDGANITKSSSMYGGGTFQLWDTNSGELITTLTGHSDVIDAFTFSKDGKTLATGSWDGTILIWDWEKISSLR